MNIVDLTFELTENCMTCGTEWHEKVKIRRLGSVDTVGRNTSSFLIGSHSGTHIDAPLHFFENAYGVEKLDLSVLCGPVTVVDFTYIKRRMHVKLEDIFHLEISERMLFRFDWWKNWMCNDYYKDFPYFTVEAAEYLVENGLKLIALDTPSPDMACCIQQQEAEDSPVHKLFLKHGVIIVEYLNHTDKIHTNCKLQLAALPLCIKGADGAPARVIIMEEEK